jgi:hypothetical protein
MTAASFGDNVRIRNRPVTEDAGVVGLCGVVYGMTTPSHTGVAIIGSLKEDYAINVYFAARGESLWFAPDLIEVINHGAGTEITLDGVDKKWIRRADGGWDEHSTQPTRRPWWKFWGNQP